MPTLRYADSPEKVAALEGIPDSPRRRRMEARQALLEKEQSKKELQRLEAKKKNALPESSVVTRKTTKKT